jgi:hypothetical protein
VAAFIVIYPELPHVPAGSFIDSGQDPGGLHKTFFFDNIA